MNFDLISLIVDSLLAIAALVIAVIQWIGEIRERKAAADEEKKRNDEKAQVKDILNKINDIDFDIMDKAVDRIYSIAGVARKENQGQDPSEVIKIIDDALDAYEECFKANKKNLEELYMILLRNEDRFPMAHGYGRYIEDLREILNYDGLIRKRRIAGYDYARVQYYYVQMHVMHEKGGIVDASASEQLAKLLEMMMQGLEPVLCHADKINSLLDELHCKYDQYQKDSQLKE